MFKGSFVALITPFTEKGEVDFKALEKLLEWQLEEGTQGIILCGSTGEGSALSDEEKCAIFSLGVKILKRKIPIIASTGSNNTEKTVQLTKQAKSLGVDGCIITMPYYNRPTEEGCFEHFKAIAKADIPVIIYHHPGRCGLKLSVNGLLKICTLPQIVGIKESSEDLYLASELVQKCSKNLFSGDDCLALAHIASGFHGIISIIGNVIPRQWRQFVDLAVQDRISEARAQFFQLYALCKAMILEVNPQCIKYAMHLLGKCTPTMRLPLMEPRNETKKLIQQALENTLEIFAGLLN